MLLNIKFGLQSFVIQEFKLGQWLFKVALTFWNAGFFDKKVVGIVESTRVDPGVYNGRQKIIATDEMFMTGDKILESIKGLKLKNTEGYDRIPQRIIIDGGMVLCKPLENLFRLIYRDKWKKKWNLNNNK